MQMVARESAKDSAIRPVPINVDHSGLNKCARMDDQRYVKLHGFFQDMKKPFPRIVNKVLCKQELCKSCRMLEMQLTILMRRDTTPDALRKPERVCLRKFKHRPPTSMDRRCFGSRAWQAPAPSAMASVYLTPAGATGRPYAFILPGEAPEGRCRATPCSAIERVGRPRATAPSSPHHLINGHPGSYKMQGLIGFSDTSPDCNKSITRGPAPTVARCCCSGNSTDRGPDKPGFIWSGMQMGPRS